MLYESSRGSFKNIKSVDVIKMGIAPDGGLFVPEETIELKSEVIEKMANMNYWERAAAVLEPFLSDYTREELKECIRNA